MEFSLAGVMKMAQSTEAVMHLQRFALKESVKPPMERPMGDTTERRRQHRLPMQIQVQYATVDEFMADWTANISIGGMYIQTQTPLAVGTRFRLQFTLPGIARPFDCVAQVRWTVPPTDGKRIPGMGVRFDGISEADWRRVREAWQQEQGAAEARSSGPGC